MGESIKHFQRCQPQERKGDELRPPNLLKMVKMNKLECHLTARKQEHTVALTPGITGACCHPVSPPRRRLPAPVPADSGALPAGRLAHGAVC